MAQFSDPSTLNDLDSRVSLWATWLVVLLLLCVSESTAQTTDQSAAQRPRQVNSKAQEPEDVLRIDTDLVSVDATVVDAAGHTVRTLQQKDFKIFEDGIEQPLTFFHMENRTGETRPLAIVFAIDISGSMTPEEIGRLRSAMHAFSEKLTNHPAVFAVMTFGMQVKTLLHFTNEAGKLDSTFDKIAREPNGMSTHAYDAVDDAIRLLVKHAPRTRERRLMKRAVVMVTDGFPVGDTVSPATVIERANAADTSVYVVTLPSYSRLSTNEQTPLPTPLDVSGLVELTGGKSVYANEKDYDPLFRALAEEVLSSYVLAFYPPEEKRHDGKVHTIRVEVPSGLTVRQSRPGYRAGSQ